jgi:transcriptional regulator with XRE-family HTH domain
MADGARATGKRRRDCFQGCEHELLGEGFAANLTTVGALQQRAGLTAAEAAEALCVSPRTYRRWKAGDGVTPTAVRLLAILAGYVPWPGWEGWEVHRGVLFPPGYTKGGISPGEYFALFFYRQQASELRRKVAALEAELERVRSTQPQAGGEPRC